MDLHPGALPGVPLRLKGQQATGGGSARRREVIPSPHRSVPSVIVVVIIRFDYCRTDLVLSQGRLRLSSGSCRAGGLSGVAVPRRRLRVKKCARELSFSPPRASALAGGSLEPASACLRPSLAPPGRLPVCPITVALPKGREVVHVQRLGHRSMRCGESCSLVWVMKGTTEVTILAIIRAHEFAADDLPLVPES